LATFVPTMSVRDVYNMHKFRPW